MGNNLSKPIVQETKAVQEDKELLNQKLEKHILDLERSYDLLKKCNTTKDQLNQLQQEGKFQDVLQGTIHWICQEIVNPTEYERCRHIMSTFEMS
jgi:hypothetical protein